MLQERLSERFAGATEKTLQHLQVCESKCSVGQKVLQERLSERFAGATEKTLQHLQVCESKCSVGQKVLQERLCGSASFYMYEDLQAQEKRPCSTFKSERANAL